MDIVGLENPAKIRLVRRARAQPLDRRFLVTEGLKKGVREIHGIKRLFRQLRNSFFDFNGVQRVKPSSDFLCFLGLVQRGSQALSYVTNTGCSADAIATESFTLPYSLMAAATARKSKVYTVSLLPEPARRRPSRWRGGTAEARFTA
jgi:hypothetical protein